MVSRPSMLDLLRRPGLAPVFGAVLASIGCSCPYGEWDVAKIVAVDAGPDADLGVDAGCPALCPDGSICTEIPSDGGRSVLCEFDGGTGECGVGRRPAGLRPPPRGRGGAIGAFFARTAYREAASVAAFAILA